MKYIFIIITFLLAVPFIYASQPTQQYNKIYLKPFYLSEMSNNVNYNFNVTVSPPDDISSVINAMISFQIYLTPTVTFYLTVNEQNCTPSGFLVHTTYMDSGYGVISYDCSNIINKEGVYNIVIRPSGANTGAVYGWLDLTYMNNPVGNINIFGTEYIQGEGATVFLQLQDNQGFPVHDATCYLNAYYPLVNNTHAPYLTSAPLMHLDGSAGIYYYDIVQLPDVLGVYMMTASCSYSTSQQFVYATDGTDANYPNRTAMIGTYSGTPIVLNSYLDNLYTTCASAGGGTKSCSAIYDYNASIKISDLSLITELNLYFMGEASINALITFYAYNWSSGTWVTLANKLTFSGLAASGPTGTNDFITNTIPINGTINTTTGIIRIRATSSAGTVFQEYINWLNINLVSSVGAASNLKGSSEMHINKWYYNYTKLIANEVWNWHPRFANITNESVERIWNYTTRNLTNLSNVDIDIINAVWHSDNRTLTNLSYGILATAVWERPQRNLTYSNITMGKLATYVWERHTRNLTYSNITMGKLASYVWERDVRNLTYSNITAGKFAQVAWSYPNRTLTNITYGYLASVIWDYPVRNLTYTPPTNITYGKLSENIWNYIGRYTHGIIN